MNSLVIIYIVVIYKTTQELVPISENILMLPPLETNIPAHVELYGANNHDGVKLRFCIVPT